jgi:UDP-N-acetyl-D-mannosaminuronate dehydrogenase
MLNNVAVIGLGNAGLPLAAVIADSGTDVIGVDIDADRCLLINRGSSPIPEEPGLEELIRAHGGKRLRATADFQDARGCGAFIVIVPLFVDEGYNPDWRVLEAACRSLGKIL